MRRRPGHPHTRVRHEKFPHSRCPLCVPVTFRPGARPIEWRGTIKMRERTVGFQGRAAWIDSLRGIAALGVACYHILRYAPLNDRAREILPQWLQIPIDHGWVGVQVFFVISGFVIAYSVRGAKVTPGYLANYALRRSVRLDPPYWTTILFVLFLHATWHLHLGWESPLDIPTKFESTVSWKLVGLHLVYMQEIFGHENLSAGFWSLCIEIQFYLLFVSGLGIAQCLPMKNRQSAADAGPLSLFAVFGPLALLSLYLWNRQGVYDNEMWIIRYFSMFFLGTAVWWTIDQRIPHWSFWLYVAAFVVRIGWSASQFSIDWNHLQIRLPDGSPWFIWSDKLTIALTIALLAGLATYTAGRLGKLGSWLNFQPLQYLGKISYSLYLIHFPISHVVKTIGQRLSGDNASPLVALLWLLLSLAASIATADVMYRWIEAPSVRLASRLKRQPAPNPTV
jgi:peptidoglycan/LPS O-acetylase OafA/YrhL